MTNVGRKKSALKDFPNTFWKTLKSKVVFESPWLKLKLDSVKLPNGISINDYSVVELPSVVVVLATTEKGKVVLVKQYRYAVNKVFIELPAGTFNHRKESAKKAAIRELWEETGYKANDMIQLGETYEYPTKLTHSVTSFLAQNVKYSPVKTPDETEEITILEVSFEKAVELVKKGEICVAGSVTAILLANDYLAKLDIKK